MTLPKESLNIIAGMIEKALGIQYSEENHYQLAKRLGEVATSLGMKDTDELFHVLREGRNQKAMSAVLDAATNNETSFFRDISMFDAFAGDLLGNPEFLGNKQDYVRVWSAASSTGQEAYSLAMLLRQWQLQKPNRNYEILVTDYSERVLKQAKDGRYTRSRSPPWSHRRTAEKVLRERCCGSECLVDQTRTKAAHELSAGKPAGGLERIGHFSCDFLQKCSDLSKRRKQKKGHQPVV